jgi:hypothetical protein
MPILNDMIDHELFGPAIRQGLEKGLEQGLEKSLKQGRQELLRRQLRVISAGLSGAPLIQ